MANIGKCFVFYLRYQPEMLRLFWKGKKHAGDSVDAETMKMVNAVGEQCCQEVGSFLGRCGEIIGDHFGAIGNFKPGAPNLTTWELSFGIWPRDRRRPQNERWKMLAGVTIPRTKAEVVPWIWGRNKADAEDNMANNFGDWVKKSSELDFEPGTVALARIPILADGTNGFDLDGDALLNQVKEAFTRVNKVQFENVYTFNS